MDYLNLLATNLKQPVSPVYICVFLTKKLSRPVEVSPKSKHGSFLHIVFFFSNYGKTCHINNFFDKLTFLVVFKYTVL